MSDDTIGRIVTSICYSLPPTLVALAGLRQSRRNNQQVEQKAKELARTTADTAAISDQKADALLTKADEIHEQTNSNLTKVKADLAAALIKIEQLEARVASLLLERA